jgi:hypothetical protein
MQYIRSYLPYWRPFLHLQPEDAPCRGDKDPVITGVPATVFRKNVSAARGGRRVIPGFEVYAAGVYVGCFEGER